MCASLGDEIARTLRLYGALGTEDGVGGIYLSGGSAKVPGLCPTLAEKLGVPVRFAEPFRSFNVPRNIDRDYLADSELVLTVGAGLCIRRPGDR